MKSEIETEAKIKVNKLMFDKMISVLGKADFIVQRNDFFQNLQGDLIRLRFERGTIVLNRKTKVNYFTKFKSKKEEEINFFNKEGENVLLFLGFKKIFSYVKERANFNLNNCIISLDKFENNKYFIEIEGEEKYIEEIINQLNLNSQILEKRSYLEILREEKWVV